MIFLSAQPAIRYYSWQVEVMINNFIDNNVNPSDIHIVCYITNDSVPTEWQKLKTHYKEVNFHFYNDTRKTRYYISSIRPNIIKQHFKKYPELAKESIFYCDCDILFTKPIDWGKFTQDSIVYGSDTKFYVGYNYIKSKGTDILNKMLEIANIDENLVMSNENNTIGAQYLLKNVDFEFWENVEHVSEQLYHEITKMNKIKKESNPNYHEIQIWCSDMWAILWEIWKRGYQTNIHEDFNFSWGTSTLQEYEKCNILHNAGVTSSSSGLFYKAEYMNRLPYNLNLDIKESTASKKYYEAIQKTETMSCLL